MADALYKLKHGVSPVEMACSLILKTKVDQQVAKQLLTDIMEGVVLIEFSNDPRTVNGVDPLITLQNYFHFQESETAVFKSWWRSHGRHAAQLVQQAYLSQSYVIQPSLASTALTIIPTTTASASLRPATKPRSSLRARGSTDMVVHRPSVSTSSYPVAVGRDAAAAELMAASIVETTTMRQLVLGMVSKHANSSFKGTKRATRDLNRQPFASRHSCLVEFTRGVTTYRKLRPVGDLCALEVLDCFVATEVPPGYAPPFDRNDLMLTNRAALEIVSTEPVALVLLECGSVPLYATWCEDSQLECLKGKICDGTVVCNASVTDARSVITSLSVIYPADTFYGPEVLIMLHLLENEIEILRTLRPPKGANHVIPHGTHMHFYKDGLCHNANVRVARMRKDVNTSLAELQRVVDSYGALIRTLPSLVVKLVTGVSNDTGRRREAEDLSQRCVSVFLEQASSANSNVMNIRNRCLGMLARFREIDSQRREAVERAWVHGQIKTGSNTQTTFESMATACSEPPAFYKESYAVLTATVRLMETHLEEMQAWDAVRNMKWCIAAHTLGIWSPSEVVPPPLIKKTLLDQISTAYRAMMMSVHPDKSKSAHPDKSHQVNSAKEYMLETITLVC